VAFFFLSFSGWFVDDLFVLFIQLAIVDCVPYPQDD
jgi:hypothetical protein